MAAGNSCSPDAARAAMKDIMSDVAPPSQVAAFLSLLGPTRDAAVVSAAAEVMLSYSVPIELGHPTATPQPTCDIVGTSR